jgi:hypothetical protein
MYVCDCATVLNELTGLRRTWYEGHPLETTPHLEDGCLLGCSAV